jgi:DNA-binding FadR family transcriptional regulator
MDRFGISPMIMSETLRILRGRGLVTVRPGTAGGIFVAALPPQIRLGGMDLWFHDSGTHPLDLFEARVHLEAQLTPVAFDRATEDDITAMRAPLDQMSHTRNADSYLEAVMTLHRALVAGAHVPVLDAMHQTVVAVLRSTLTRAVFIDGHEPLLRHSIGVHQGIVEAISSRNRPAFHKAMLLHDDDLTRSGDPRRSPRAGLYAELAQTLRVEEQARAHRPWGEQTILHPCTDGLVAYQQNPGGDGDADWPGRRQRIVRHVNEAGSLLRAFGTNRVGDVKYFVHPCEQVSNRRFLSLHRRGCHASDYAAKIGSMLVPLLGGLTRRVQGTRPLVRHERSFEPNGRETPAALPVTLAADD